jgi:hypothetical protein
MGEKHRQGYFFPLELTCFSASEVELRFSRFGTGLVFGLPVRLPWDTDGDTACKPKSR